jgi:hypothetical protein
MTGITVDVSSLTTWTSLMYRAPAVLRSEMAKRTIGLLQNGAGIMRTLAPRLTGRLAGSIGVTRSSATGGTFGTSLVYAAQRNFGGTIRARNAPYLVFPGRNGGLVRVKSVTQTGTHYLERTVVRLRPIIQTEYRAALRAALGKS